MDANRKLRAYLAAPWVWKEAAKEAKILFEEAGFDVTSRWIEYHGDTDDPTELEQEAINDLEDIYFADGMVVLQLEKSEGKAFEQGAAIHMLANKIIVVSPAGVRGNVFQYLTHCFTFVKTIDEAIKEARTWT